jgi:hypothetical protein
MKTIRPYCLLITGFILLGIGGYCLIDELIIKDDITISIIFDYATWLLLILLGFFLLKNKYCYNDKYFVHYIFFKSHPIIYENIISISNNQIIGFFSIRTDIKIYHFPLMFQKKELLLFSEFVKNVNKNCKVYI